MAVFPLAADMTVTDPTTGEPRTVYADGTRVVMRRHQDFPDGTHIRRATDRHGVTCGFQRGGRYCKDYATQAVIWDDGPLLIDLGPIGKADPAALALEKPAPTRRPLWHTKHAARVTYYAKAFLTAAYSPVPKDEYLALYLGGPMPAGFGRRPASAHTGRPAPLALYPAIRVKVFELLAERARQSTPGAPQVMVTYSPWTGPEETVPLAIGNRVMHRGYASGRWFHGTVTAIADTPRGVEVNIHEEGSTPYTWDAAAVSRHFVKVDNLGPAR